MSANNDVSIQRNQDELRRMQELQEQQRQEQMRAQQERDAAQAQQAAADLQPDKVDTQNMDAAATRDAEEKAAENAASTNARLDTQAQAQAQEVSASDEVQAVSGAEKSQQAQELASTQQDRGEQWESFRAKESDLKLPPTPEEQAALAQRQNQDEQQKLLNLRDIMNAQKIKSGRFDA